MMDRSIVFLVGFPLQQYLHGLHGWDLPVLGEKSAGDMSINDDFGQKRYLKQGNIISDQESLSADMSKCTTAGCR